MGNKQVIQDGRYIIGKKVKRKELILEGKDINLQNLFGHIEIPTARGDKIDETNQSNIQTLSCIKYLDREEESMPELQKNIVQKPPLMENKNMVKVTDNECHQFWKNQKMKKISVPIRHQSDSGGGEKYCTRKDSPIKSQNKNVEDSQIQIFQSRLQSKYFDNSLN